MTVFIAVCLLHMLPVQRNTLCALFRQKMEPCKEKWNLLKVLLNPWTPLIFLHVSNAATTILRERVSTMRHGDTTNSKNSCVLFSWPFRCLFCLGDVSRVNAVDQSVDAGWQCHYDELIVYFENGGRLGHCAPMNPLWSLHWAGVTQRAIWGRQWRILSSGVLTRPIAFAALHGGSESTQQGEEKFTGEASERRGGKPW